MSRFEGFQFHFRPSISSTDDLRSECQRLLNIAKRILEEGKTLVPVGFVVKPDGTLDVYTRNSKPGSWQKEFSHAMLSEAARKHNAIAVILIQDTWVRLLNDLTDEQKKEYLRNYRNGNVEKDPNRTECLSLFAFGPSIKYSIGCHYHRAGDGSIIVWDEVWDSVDKPLLHMEQYLLTPWWDVTKQPVVS